MSEKPDIAAAVDRHADLILKASGSALRHYTMASTRAAILMAVMSCYEEAYRAGASFALSEVAARTALTTAMEGEKA